MSSKRLPMTVTAMAVLSVAACRLDGAGDTPGSDETSAAAAITAAADSCTAVPTVVVTPAVIPSTQVGVPVVLDVAITSADPVECAPRALQLHIDDTGLLFDPRPDPLVIASAPPTGTPVSLAGGATSHVTVTATAPASADAGDVLQVSLNLVDPSAAGPGGGGGGGGTGSGGGSGSGSGVVIVTPPPPLVSVPAIAFPVAATPGCQVSRAHELMITSLSVVDDPMRTVFDPTSRDPRNGAWTFKRLAESMARTPADAPAMVEAMLTSFATPQPINGFTVAPRAGVQTQVVARWPRTADGALDLAKAPVHLQAIVNRFDLRNLANGDAGEGRFVFAFDLVPLGLPPQATIIFEYKLPAASDRDVLGWAASFHLLGRLPFGEAYNAVLQLITERFTRRGARPGHPNGSAINAVRTNEVPFGDNGLWELREFHLSASSGRLEPATVDLTPDLSFNRSDALAAYITANQAEILAETHIVPEILDGAPFKAGAVFNNLTTWFAPGVDPEARHHFAINTCNGCHSAQETGTGFLHITPRASGVEAPLSRWLTGTVIDDPVTGSPRSFDDLGRRKADLKAIVCPASPPLDKLRKGIRRVH